MPPPPPKLQRSGNQGSLPDLLTQEALEKMFPNIMPLKRYKAYYDKLCSQVIVTAWREKVFIDPARFWHIVSTAVKGQKSRQFSQERASFLSFIEPVILGNSTNWHQAWTKGNCSANRMIGNIPGTNFVVIIQAPKYHGGLSTLVTAYPMKNPFSNTNSSPIILNPSKYFAKKQPANVNKRNRRSA